MGLQGQLAANAGLNNVYNQMLGQIRHRDSLGTEMVITTAQMEVAAGLVARIPLVDPPAR